MYCKPVYLLLILLLSFSKADSQIGETEALGSVFLAKVSPGTSAETGRSDLPVCTPRSYACNTPASINYIFTGAGSWVNPENWTNELIPPPSLKSGYGIIIDPRGSSDCILNIRQTLDTGARLTVLPGKTLKVVSILP